MIERRDDPWKPESEKDIDGVGSGDVSDRIVRVLLVCGGGLAGKSIRQGGAQGHKSNCCQVKKRFTIKKSANTLICSLLP